MTKIVPYLLLVCSLLMLGLPVVSQAMPAEHQHANTTMVSEHTMAHCNHTMNMPDCPFCHDHERCDQMQSACGSTSSSATLTDHVIPVYLNNIRIFLQLEKPQAVPFQRHNTLYRPPISV